MQSFQRYHEEIQSENEFNNNLKLNQMFTQLSLTPAQKWKKTIELSDCDCVHIGCYKKSVQLYMNCIIPFGYEPMSYNFCKRPIKIGDRLVNDKGESKYVNLAGYFHVVDKYLFRAAVCNLLFICCKHIKNFKQVQILVNQYYLYWKSLPEFIRDKEGSTEDCIRFRNLNDCEKAGQFVSTIFDILFTSPCKFGSFDNYYIDIEYDRVMITNTITGLKYSFHQCHANHAINKLQMR